jgi:hypothetical protein
MQLKFPFLGEHINRNITLKIILQFMNYLCIFNEGNSMKINFVLHSESYTIPILVCNKNHVSSHVHFQNQHPSRGKRKGNQ